MERNKYQPHYQIQQWGDEDIDPKKVLSYDSESNGIDRYEFGQQLLRQTAELARLGREEHI